MTNSLIDYPKDAWFASLEEAQAWLDKEYNRAEDEALKEKLNERVYSN